MPCRYSLQGISLEYDGSEFQKKRDLFALCLILQILFRWQLKNVAAVQKKSQTCHIIQKQSVLKNTFFLIFPTWSSNFRSSFHAANGCYMVRNIKPVK